MPYVFQKYPMSLYFGGDVQAKHVIVRNEDEEQAMRDEGFCGAGESQEKANVTPCVTPNATPAPRKPGRPRKVTE